MALVADTIRDLRRRLQPFLRLFTLFRGENSAGWTLYPLDADQQALWDFQTGGAIADIPMSTRWTENNTSPLPWATPIRFSIAIAAATFAPDSIPTDNLHWTRPPPG